MAVIRDRLRWRWLAVAAALTAWLPVEVMSIARAHASHTDVATLLHQQIAMMARSLVCVPLFVLAEGVCTPRLWLLANNFVAADLIGDRAHFDAAMRRAERSMNATRPRVLAVVLAYACTSAVAWYSTARLLPPWHRAYGMIPLFSPAGWWHVLVSLPLLLALAFNWLWRLVTWDALLWRIAHSRLRLVASHPDRCAGLGFVGESVRVFAVVGLAFSALAAGRAAQLVSRGAALPLPEIYFNATFLIAIGVLFVGPLFVFTPQLLRASRDGILRYGSLAHRIGSAFEQRWLSAGGRAASDAALEASDFSALIDLYSVVAIAGSVKRVPVNRAELLSFAFWLVVPFVPVLLMTVPLQTLLSHVKELLL